MNILESAITKLGNKIELIGESGDNNVLIIGVFHGDEPQGKYLIEKYLALPPLPNPSIQVGREYRKQQYSFFAKVKAKELRKNMTDAEQILWYFLRANRLFGLKFKRQQPIGNYIVDFVNFQNKLVIELDGSQHNENINIEKDNERTKFLESNGYKVLRFWNNDIFENIEGCIESIIDSLPTASVEFERGVVSGSLPPASGELGRGDEYGSLPPSSGEFERGVVSGSLPPLRGRVRERGVLFIPCLNPDGLSSNTRTNANGVDLNRNFPTKNFGQDGSSAGNNPENYYGGKEPASEIETRFVIDILEKYQPKLVITLHAPYKIVNYDGPAEAIAQKISDIIGYSVESSIGYPTPGSFGTYCGVERNIPTITLELDEEIPVEQLEQPVFEVFNMLKYSIS